MHGPVRRRSSSRALLAGIAAGLLACASCSKGEPEGPRPDVVLIVVDTLRADRLGCYGYPRATSPLIDGLAAEGALFETVAAQAPWTLVSMTSMISGRYVTAHREFPAEEWPTMAEVFRAAGYRTIGLSANPLLDEEGGFARGFESYAYSDPGNPNRGVRNMELLVQRLWAPIDAALASGDGGAEGERAPLFVYIQPFDPHAPYENHPEFEDELPRDGARPFEPQGWHLGQLEAAGLSGPADDPEWTRALDQFGGLRGRYDQEVRYVDRQIEVLLAGLRQRGLLDDAIVALVSDHGEGLWDHVTPGADPMGEQNRPETFFVQGHGHDLYLPATATPFLLWGARVPAGVRVDEPVENIDLFPTLLDLAGLDRPRGIDGHSLVGLMRGTEKEWRRYAFIYVRHLASVYDHETGLKLIEPTGFGLSRGLRSELYHLPSDPLERIDLHEQRPDEAARLNAVLAEWIERHPTQPTTGAERSERRNQLLENLGYGGDHAPGVGDDKEDEDEAEDRR